MPVPYLGEIRMFAGDFPPLGWSFCDGRPLPIAGNEELFKAIGTTYGGDGKSTFALPDLQRRVPVHFGTKLSKAGLTTRALGESGGVDSVTLTKEQIPAHSHALVAASLAANVNIPVNQLPAVADYNSIYNPAGTGTRPIAPLLPKGGGQAHENRMPFVAINFIVAREGLPPPRSGQSAPAEYSSAPFLGEIRILPYGFVPKGWAACNGQLRPTSSTALFALLDFRFGGDGRSQFALPNLQGCVPVHAGQNTSYHDYMLGQTGGEQSVVLGEAAMPPHTHTPRVTNRVGSTNSPGADGASLLAPSSTKQAMFAANSNATMHEQAVALSGGNRGHNNLQPYLVMQFCISVEGEFPPRP